MYRGGTKFVQELDFMKESVELCPQGEESALDICHVAQESVGVVKTKESTIEEIGQNTSRGRPKRHWEVRKAGGGSEGGIL